MKERIGELLRFIYGEKRGEETANRLLELAEEEGESIEAPSYRGTGELPLSQEDAFLITYGDSLEPEGAPPLEGLRDFAREKLEDSVSGIHILPFFPYSSDDGFSIIDYYEVNPELGTWKEVSEIGSTFKLMSDLVLNHCSSQNEWFRKFLAGEPGYENFFIAVDPETDLSSIVRPRTHPLLTPYESSRGTLHVWTTFSADQVDLNFAEPAVLLEMVRVLLYHIRRGIQVIRLDAIAYLWKEIGHPSIHHEKTHAVVKLFRTLLDKVAPWVVIITETNVPHEENVSYFGNYRDEAHMVYQFPLPPLTLDAFLREDARRLAGWASNLPDTGGRTTFFNFLASHDGIGLLPAQGILSREEIDGLVRAAGERGGFINYKATPEGKIPYEMNITYLDAVAEKDLNESVRARKFLASQAVMLSVPGVPGIYVHSLLGSGNYREGVEKTGQNRTINREKLNYREVLEEINTPGTLRNRIFSGYTSMLNARKTHKAFHPSGTMEVVHKDHRIFSLLRVSEDKSERVICIINVSSQVVTFELPFDVLKTGVKSSFTEIIGGETVSAEVGTHSLRFQIQPYGVYWLS
ncbi:MAG: alpha-amylase family glycosyl hydrolase [Spirochaetaceae bacterium]